MRYDKGINNKTLKMNTGELLKKYDKDGNGFNQKELKELIKGSVSIIGKPFITNSGISKVQNIFDKNHDGIISEKELDNYLKENYGINLNTAKSMNVKDLTDKIYKIDQKKKNK